MRLELFLAFICTVVAFASNYIFFVFALHTKINNLPGSEYYQSSTVAIVKKYPINIYPAKQLVALAWPSILIMNGVASVALSLASLNGKKILHTNFYLTWLIQMLATAAWTLTFDKEKHLSSLFLLVITFLSFCSSIISVCSRTVLPSENGEKVPLPESCRWWFDGLVMNYFGMVGSWIFLTFSATMNYAIAYKESVSFDQGQLTGLCTIENCGIVSLVPLIIAQFLWTIIDLRIYPNYTKSINLFYPSHTLFMFGVFLSNYDPELGLSTCNAICLAVSVLSLLTWIFRAKLRLQNIPVKKD